VPVTARPKYAPKLILLSLAGRCCSPGLSGCAAALRALLLGGSKCKAQRHCRGPPTDTAPIPPRWIRLWLWRRVPGSRCPRRRSPRWVAAVGKGPSSAAEVRPGLSADGSHLRPAHSTTMHSALGSLDKTRPSPGRRQM